MGKALSYSLCIILPILFTYTIQAQCPEGGITLQGQSEVDQFAIDYPDCTEITGRLNIRGGFADNQLMDLSPLSNLQTITSDLDISFCRRLRSLHGLHNLQEIEGDLLLQLNDSLINFNAFSGVSELRLIHIENCFSLENLNGLENLTRLDRLIIYNSGIKYLLDTSCLITEIFELNIRECDSLQTINGFEHLEKMFSIGFNVELCPALTKIDGFYSLDSVFSDLSISRVPNLSDINGLQNLRYIGQSIRLESLSSLTDLTGFRNVNFIGFRLRLNGLPRIKNLDGLQRLTRLSRLELTNNDSLTSLTGIQNINPTFFGGIKIESNTQLSDCSVLSVCRVLDSDLANPNLINISDNRTRWCANQREIETGCALVVVDTQIFRPELLESEPFLGNLSSQPDPILKSGVKNQTSNPIIIYPNPVEGQLYVRQLKGEIDKIELYSPVGKKVNELICKRELNVSIDCTRLPKGAYLLVAYSKDQTIKNRIVIH